MVVQVPSKEQVRQYMTERAVKHSPPPSPAEIRRQLGWGLISTNEADKFRQR